MSDQELNNRFAYIGAEILNEDSQTEPQREAETVIIPLAPEISGHTQEIQRRAREIQAEGTEVPPHHQEESCPCVIVTAEKVNMVFRKMVDNWFNEYPNSVLDMNNPELLERSQAKDRMELFRMLIKELPQEIGPGKFRPHQIHTLSEEEATTLNRALNTMRFYRRPGQRRNATDGSHWDAKKLYLKYPDGGGIIICNNGSYSTDCPNVNEWDTYPTLEELVATLVNKRRDNSSRDNAMFLNVKELGYQIEADGNIIPPEEPADDPDSTQELPAQQKPQQEGLRAKLKAALQWLSDQL